MLAVLYALLAAVLWGTYSILAKRALRYSNPLSGILTVLIVEASMFVSLAVFTGSFFIPLEPSTTLAVVTFIVAGFLAPGLGNMMMFVGIERLGVVVSSPISAASPLFAAIGAAIFLGERLTASIIGGTILLSIGIALVSQEEPERKARGWRETFRTMRRWDVVFPLFGAFCFGFADVVRKIGLNFFKSPILGIAIGTATSLTVFVVASTLTGMRQNISTNRRGVTLFALAGVLHGIGLLSLFYALSLGQVVLVKPLASAYPLFTLLLAHLFLRGVEKVTPRIVCGAMLIVLSVILITLV